MEIRKSFRNRFGAVLILAAIFPGGIAHAADTEVSDYVAQLRNSYAILANPEADRETKRQVVHEMFERTQSMCVERCDVALETLRKFNDYVGAGKLEDLLQKVPEGPRKALNLTPGQIVSAQKNLSQFLARYETPASREALKNKIRIGSELIRYVLALEEDHLLEVIGGDEARKIEGLMALRADIQVYIKQGKAIREIHLLLEETGGLEGVSKPAQVARLVGAINDLGFFYVKLAQSISNLGVLPPTLLTALKDYQDKVPPMSPEDVDRIILEDLGRPANEIFVDWDPKAYFKSGTVAQTYKVRIRRSKWRQFLGFGESEEIILKVQRPGLKVELDWHRKITRLLLQSAALVTGKDTVPMWVVDLFAGAVVGLENAMESELDFRIEARNMSRFRRFFSFDPGTKVPKVIRGLSTKRLLAMDLIDGENIQNLLDGLADGTPETAALRKKIFSKFISTFLFQVLGLGELHADMHPGNVLMNRQGGLGLVDWGQTFRTRGLVSTPIKLFYAVSRGDPDDFVKALGGLGKIPEDRLSGMREMVRRRFDEVGIRSLGHKSGLLFKNFWKEEWKIENDLITLGEDRVGHVFAALGKIFEEATKEYGFVPHATYLQFFRSASPVFSLLHKLSLDIPKRDVIKILVLKTIALVPKTMFQYVSEKVIRAFDFTMNLGERCLLWLRPSRPSSEFPLSSALPSH